MVEEAQNISTTQSLATAILSACEELIKTLADPAGVPLEELQGATEYLLDNIKKAKRQGLKVIAPPKSRRVPRLHNL